MNTIFKAIDNQQDKMITLLQKWANINSSSDNIEGLQKMLKEIKKEALKLNGEMEEIVLPKRKKVDSTGNIVETPHGNALVIKKHKEAKVQVLLAGHYDTVYEKNSPFQKTEMIDSNTLKGPGTADMKGGLIIMLKALQTIEKSPYAGKLGFEVIINPDEEIGSSASEHLFKKAAVGKDYGLIFEPSFADGALVSSRKGSANFTLAVFGKAAHAGRDFDKGKSAIIALSSFIHEAHALNNPEKQISINFGAMEAKNPVNIVPDFAICQINVRFFNLADFKNIHTSLLEIVKKWNAQEGFKMVLHENSMRGPKPLDEKTIKLFDILKNVGLQQSLAITLRPSGGVSDGNILAAVGLPTIDTLGVIGGNIHTPLEYMLLDSLKERVKLTVCLLIEFIKRSET